MTQKTDARCDRLLDVLFNPRDMEEIKKSILYHLMSLQGRDPERAGPGDMCKALAYMMRDSLVEKWIKTQREYYAGKKNGSTTCPWNSSSAAP